MGDRRISKETLIEPFAENLRATQEDLATPPWHVVHTSNTGTESVAPQTSMEQTCTHDDRFPTNVRKMSCATKKTTKVRLQDSVRFSVLNVRTSL